MAGVGAGLHADLATATYSRVTLAETTAPDASAIQIEDARFVLFQDLYEAARPVNARLSGA